MDHVTFWMPVLVLTVPEDLDELLKNGGLAAIAALRELGGIVIVAVHLAVVLVVAVLGAEYGGAQGAGEVIDVVFALEGCDVGPSQRSAALMA